MESWKIYRWTKTDDNGCPTSHGKHNGIWEMSGNVERNYIQITKTEQENGLMGDFQGSHICEIHPAYGKLGRKKAEINARLIAAAPLMLSALLKCHDYMHDLVAANPGANVSDLKDADLGKAYKAVWDAINAATQDETIIPPTFVL